MLKFAALIAVLFCANGCATRITSPTVDDSYPWPTTATAGALRLSPRNTRITFIGSALLNSHEGTFTRFAGRLECPGPDPKDAHLGVVIDMASVYTEIPLLTKHLKEQDFFDVAKYPTATFVSTRIEPAPPPDKTATITGTITIHGVAKDISFPARLDVEPGSLTLDATFVIRQSDFGMQSSRTTNDDVPTSVSIRLRRSS